MTQSRGIPITRTGAATAAAALAVRKYRSRTRLCTEISANESVWSTGRSRIEQDRSARDLPYRIATRRRGERYNPPAVESATMSDEPIEAAVERFLNETESSLDSYDQGYADADATISVIRTHIDELADAVDDERTE
ncbi:hypothetical protein FK85_30285 [Halorubrum saccharovorum]|uniref:Uncharacterized protein n=2 Tax=Haloferacaceae TaxID=1644056 RepID=A0A0F8AUI6_9EURY|nr:hypothetical protein FK85_30285 [Halorubrum saccharovorum]